MVRALKWPALIAVSVCALAVVAAMLVPGRQVLPPGQSGALGFETCAPPCWAGIRVGETTLAEAVERFDANVGAQLKQINLADYGAVYWGVLDSASLQPVRTSALSGNFQAKPGETQVSYMHLNLGVPLWYLLLTLGDPVDVVLHQPFPDVHRVDMILHWVLPEATASATLSVPTVDDWGFNTPVSSLTFATNTSHVTIGRAQRPYYVVGRTTWQGFVPYLHYVLDASRS